MISPSTDRPHPERGEVGPTVSWQAARPSYYRLIALRYECRGVIANRARVGPSDKGAWTRAGYSLNARGWLAVSRPRLGSSIPENIRGNPCLEDAGGIGDAASVVSADPRKCGKCCMEFFSGSVVFSPRAPPLGVVFRQTLGALPRWFAMAASIRHRLMLPGMADV
jgi:hypothetical protein